MSTQSRALSQIQGVNVTPPTQAYFTATGLENYANDAAFVVAHPSPQTGSVYWNTTEKCLREYNGTQWQYDKTTYLVATDNTTTGAAQSITPAEAQIIRFTQGSLTSINNIVPTLQKLIYLVNDQSTQAITITNDSGGTAANRIQTGNGVDFLLKTGQILGLVYDNINTRWRVISRPITGIEAFATDAAFVTAHGTASVGDRYWNTTSLIVREHDGTSWANQKTLLSTENNTALTGALQDVTPAYDQIIKFSNASLTSIRSVNPALQKYLILINGTGVSITIKNQDATATAANRIITGTQNDIVLANDGSLLLSYDSNSSRWRVVGGTGTGSSSSTSINYFTDPTCENTSVGTLPTQAVQYNDGAVAIPVDGTGGAAVAQVTLLASQTSPIRGTQSFILAKDANNRQGVGYAFPFTIPAVDAGLTAVWSFEYVTDTNFATSDVGVWLYDVTNSALITPRLTSISKADTGGKVRSDYTLRSGTSYRWILHIASTNALAWNLKIDTMVNTTDPNYAIGPANNNFAQYTPTFSGLGTPTAVNLAWRQEVDCYRVTGRFALGTTTGAAAQISLPNGALAAAPAAMTAGILYDGGSYRRENASSSQVKHGRLSYTPGNSFFNFGYDEYAVAIAPSSTLNGTSLGSSGEVIWIDALIPIAALQAAATFGPSVQPEYLSSSFSSFVAYRGSDGTALPTTTPAGTIETVSAGTQPFQYSQQVGDFVRMEIQVGGSGPWLPVSSSQTASDLVFDGTNWVGLGFYWDGTAYQIARGKYRSGGSALWSSILAGTRYRIPKASSAAWAGVQIANSSNQGFVAPRKGQFSLTVTSSLASWATSRALGLYYQDQDGNHRLKFSLRGTCTAGTANTLTISGVVFKNVSGWFQPVTVMAVGSSPYTATGSTVPNTATIDCVGSSAADWRISGDVELDSKPSWA